MEDKYKILKNIPKQDKARLNKLTYRQYLALQYIMTVWEKYHKLPSLEELKEVIGFKTDRMLYNTLKALDDKGFVKFYGLDHDPFLEILPHTFELKSLFVDNLILTKQYSEYDDIKERILKRLQSKKELPNYIHPPKIVPLVYTHDVIKDWNNNLQIVHRWYDYLEDFPPSLVWEKMDQFNVTRDKIVLDPFCGSGTTLIVAKLRGNFAIGIDVNPVATFVSRVKTNWETVNIAQFKEYSEQLLNELKFGNEIFRNELLIHPTLERMPKMERNQWLSIINQNYVSYVRYRIEELIPEDSLRDLFMLALIESAKDGSNVSFCPGASFYPFRKRPSFFEAFRHKLQVIYEDLYLLQKANKNWGVVNVKNGDSRKMSKLVLSEVDGVDFIFTSPPYPTDREYIRETKLELYLLGIVSGEKDLKAIRERLVKGTPKILYKNSNNAKYVKDFENIQNIVAKLKEAFKGKNWGWDYPRTVEEYFGDMYLVLNETYKVLNDNGIALFVVGDQRLKGVLVPVGKLLAELGESIGFTTDIEIFRVRKSTRHNVPLNESIVILRKE